jgi:predicted AAA+ superfamily ATPase
MNAPGLGFHESEPRIVLDEIHKYPRWKRLLKGVHDTRRGVANHTVDGIAVANASDLLART